jgi:nucleoside 2-deoxyribosyltransferase
MVIKAQLRRKQPARDIGGGNDQAPTCFVSYSTRESHVSLLIECIEIVLTPHFRIERTPSALQSGASQRDQITKLIQNCALGVVILDGLRPNVVFEYGILHGLKKPVIFFKEVEAQVDIRGFFGHAPNLNLDPVALDLDKHFSDSKDVYCASWNRFEIKKTARTIWEEYRKKKDEIVDYIDIPEPKLCT